MKNPSGLRFCCCWKLHVIAESSCREWMRINATSTSCHILGSVHWLLQRYKREDEIKERSWLLKVPHFSIIWSRWYSVRFSFILLALFCPFFKVAIDAIMIPTGLDRHWMMIIVRWVHWVYLSFRSMVYLMNLISVIR